MATTTTDKNKELIHEYITAWKARDPQAIIDCFADDFSTTYTAPTGEEVHIEAEDLHGWINGFLEVQSEYTPEVHEMVAEDDRVMARITHSWRQDGEFLGVEPTGTRVEYPQYLSFRIENGEITELHWLSDWLGVLRQLDAEIPIES